MSKTSYPRPRLTRTGLWRMRRSPSAPRRIPTLIPPGQLPEHWLSEHRSSEHQSSEYRQRPRQNGEGLKPLHARIDAAHRRLNLYTPLRASWTCTMSRTCPPMQQQTSATTSADPELQTQANAVHCINLQCDLNQRPQPMDLVHQTRGCALGPVPDISSAFTNVLSKFVSHNFIIIPIACLFIHLRYVLLNCISPQET